MISSNRKFHFNSEGNVTLIVFNLFLIPKGLFGSIEKEGRGGIFKEGRRGKT
jgi:hypothetical protein